MPPTTTSRAGPTPCVRRPVRSPSRCSCRAASRAERTDDRRAHPVGIACRRAAPRRWRCAETHRATASRPPRHRVPRSDAARRAARRRSDERMTSPDAPAPRPGLVPGQPRAVRPLLRPLRQRPAGRRCRPRASARAADLGLSSTPCRPRAGARATPFLLVDRAADRSAGCLAQREKLLGVERARRRQPPDRRVPRAGRRRAAPATSALARCIVHAARGDGTVDATSSCARPASGACAHRVRSAVRPAAAPRSSCLRRADWTDILVGVRAVGTRTPSSVDNPHGDPLCDCSFVCIALRQV